jgi:hypothetical protein
MIYSFKASSNVLTSSEDQLEPQDQQIDTSSRHGVHTADACRPPVANSQALVAGSRPHVMTQESTSVHARDPP